MSDYLDRLIGRYRPDGATSLVPNANRYVSRGAALEAKDPDNAPGDVDAMPDIDAAVAAPARFADRSAVQRAQPTHAAAAAERALGRPKADQASGDAESRSDPPAAEPTISWPSARDRADSHAGRAQADVAATWRPQALAAVRASSSPDSSAAGPDGAPGVSAALAGARVMRPAAEDRAKLRPLADAATSSDGARREPAAETAGSWPSTQDRAVADPADAMSVRRQPPAREEHRSRADDLVPARARAPGAASLSAPSRARLTTSEAMPMPSRRDASTPAPLAGEPMPLDERVATGSLGFAVESGGASAAHGVASPRQPSIVPAGVAEARRAPPATARAEPVSIKIGSVEFRSESPPAPAPAARTAGGAPPRLSLDDYLRARRSRSS